MTDERDAREQREDEEDEPDRQGLATTVTDRLKVLGKEPEDLVEETGLSLAYIRAIRNGTGISRFSLDTLSKVARALGWPDTYLYNIFYRRPDQDYVSPSMVELVKQTIRTQMDESFSVVSADIREIKDDIRTVDNKITVVLNQRGWPHRPDN